MTTRACRNAFVMAALSTALLGCEAVPTGTAEGAQRNAPTPVFEVNGTPDDGNGNKFIFLLDRESSVDCGGQTLSFEQVGWFQGILVDHNPNDLRIEVFHSVLTYANPATGETLTVVDVGPNRYYTNQDGDLIVELSGRAPTFDIPFIGHLVWNLTDPDLELVGGNFYPLDAIACDQLT